MTEFNEVMKQAARMCRAHEDCDECPVCAIADMVPGGCLFGSGIDAGYIEEKIMGWAEENPETRYPSWKEWQEKNFPNNDALMRPCIFESEEYFGCKLRNGCEECMNEPIPADIAEKLGIKPIGGTTAETPDEIKKGLEACVAGECNGQGHKCPYRDEEECTSALARDALAYIQQLEAKEPRWISVKERLPDNCDEKVLVIVDGRPRKNVELHGAYQLAIYVEGECWVVEGYEEWEGADVKWWMPLPEPPKEE